MPNNERLCAAYSVAHRYCYRLVVFFSLIIKNKIMKFQFTYGNYKDFESDLIIMGFKKYNGKLHSEDYYLAKTIHRTEPDDDGDTRSDLQLFICVYDFSKYPRFDQPDFMHLQAEIHISRNIDERIDLVVNDKICKSIHDLEQFAFKFYDFITSNVPE